MVGGGDQSQAQHGGAGEGPQDVGSVVPAVVDLHGRRFTVLGRVTVDLPSAHRVDTLGGVGANKVGANVLLRLELHGNIL